MARKWRVPFNRPALVGSELEYVREAIENGHISGGGSFTDRCQDLLRESLGAKAVMLTTSGTHALEISALLLDVGPDDEVIVPSFTFVSTANAFALRGARMVFADIRPDTLNMDEQQLPDLITDRTKAVVPVHYGGVACEMDSILQECSTRGIPVVEDNAHGLYGKYGDRYLGTMGRLGALSFHETKNMTCGEGGALILNDPALLKRAEILRDKGTNRSAFLRGDVDKYTWVSLGSSYCPSDMLAAYLLAQLEKRKLVWEKRHHLWNRYMASMGQWAGENGVGLPAVPDECTHSAHVFYMLMPDEESRDMIIRSLRQMGILAVFHYQPLHLSIMSGGSFSCPVAVRTASRLVRLPLYYSMTREEQDLVIGGVLSTRVGDH